MALRFTIIALLCLLCGCAPQTPSSIKSSTQPTVRILNVTGDGHALGLAQGAALGPQIRLLQARYMDVYFTSEPSRQRAMQGAHAFEPFIDPAHLAELHAMAEASGVPYEKLLLSQCFLDLQSMVACSTVALPAGAAPDHVARMGRNLDFPGLGIAEENTVIVVYHPKDRNAFAAVTWPGMIGVLSGMNAPGLCLASMEVDRAARAPSGMPYILLYRSILERCKDVNEAIDFLGKTPRQTANNLMLMDAAGDRAVVEITPETITVRRATASQPLISTNHQRGLDAQSPGHCPRYDTLLSTTQQSFGQIDPPRLKTMLNSVAQGDLTMQSMIFDPAHRTIDLATGRHATQHAYERVELGPWLARKR